MKNILLIIVLLSVKIVFAWNAPNLNSPSNNSNVYTGTTVDWYAVANSYQYELEISDDAGFSNILYHKIKAYINSDSYNSDTEESLSDTLKFGTTYYWRVRAYENASTYSAWSTVWAFDTRDYVSLNTPTQNGTYNTSVTLDWYAHPTVEKYEYQIDTSSTFSSPVLIQGSNNYISSSSYNADTEHDLTGLYFGKKYYWRVRAINAVDTSAWYQREFYTTDYVSLNSPTQNGTYNTSVTLDWYAHPNVVKYEYQLDTSSTFSSPVLIQGSNNYISSSSYNADTEHDVTGLYFGEKYYWRVRIINAVDTSAWTGREFYTTDYVSLDSPTQNGTYNTSVTLNWYAHPNVVKYEYQLDTSSTFSSSVLIQGSNNYINSSSYNSDTEHDVTGLYFGEKYYWRVRIINAVDTSAWTGREFYTTDYVSLDSPTQNGTYNTSVTLNWYAHPNVIKYEYQLDTSSTFSSSVLIQGSNNYINSSSYNTDTEHDLTNLYFGEKYYWRVRIINAVDTSAWTGREFYTTDYVSLDSPTQNGTYNTTVTLDWYALPDIVKYEYQVDTSSTFSSSVLIQGSNNYINSSSYNTDTEHDLTNLYFGKKYYWRVRAINAVDTSGWYQREFYTRDYVYLDSPSDGALSISTSGVTLDWYAHAGVSSYDLEIDKTNQFNSANLQQISETYINSSSNNTDTEEPSGALDPNTIYFWRVRAVNTVDTSAWTTRWFSTGSTALNLPDVPVLVSPANNATNQTLSFNFDWNDATNATGYVIEYADNSAFTSASQSSVTLSQFSVSGLNYNTTYYWRVYSTDGTNISAWSTVWSFTTQYNTLATPTLVSPSNNATNQLVNLTIDWNAVSGATSYEYQYSTDNTFATFTNGNTANTNASITGLNYNTQYYWRIKATDGSIYSTWSSVWSFTTESQTLATPTLVSPSDNVTNQLVNLTIDWNAVSGATSYEYQYSTDNTFATFTNGNTANTNASITGLSYNTQYYWRIKATDGSIYSTWSSVWSFTTESQTLATPTLLSPSDNATNQLINLDIEWNSVVNANEYQYQYSTDNTFATYTGGNTTDTSLSITGLSYNTQYYWRIKATDGSIYSTWSSVWSFTTKIYTSVAESTQNKIVIYPNPCSNYISTNYESSNILDYKIYDIQGRIVYSIQTNNNSIDISGIDKGTYMIVINDKNNIVIREVLIIE